MRIQQRIIIPGINAVTVQNLAPYGPISALIAFLIVALAWRCQATSCLQPLLKSDKAIQGSETQKFTARLLGSGPVLSFLSWHAIGTTLYLEPQIAELPEDEISQELSHLTESLTNIPDSNKKVVGKLLPENAIGQDTKLIHRIGLIQSLRGTLQTSSIFRPTEIFQGISLPTLTAESLASLINQTIITLKLPNPTLEDWTTIFPGFEPNMVLEHNPGRTAIDAMAFYLSDQDAQINDGFSLGNQTNLLPLEESFGVTRIGPALIEPIEQPKELKNKLSALLFEQQEERLRRQQGVIGKTKQNKPKTPPQALVKAEPPKASRKSRKKEDK